MPNTFDSDGDAQAHADGRPHRALSKMINQGRSFSGHERNCCFLNIGSAAGEAGRFADISAGSGLDFPDDGRAVAVVDWDADGDLDLWISNRNAPRLRFMRNDSPRECRFVALRLQGNGHDTNRDAVGARVEVRVSEHSARQAGDSGDRTKTLIKTVRAGEGFLAQSSKWLHFGLGAAETIESVVVYWPCRKAGGRKEQFTELAVDERFLLVQGAGKAVRVPSRPATMPLIPAEGEVAPPSQTARVPAVTLLRGPKLRIQGRSGQVISPGEGKPVLITLFASWCPACVQELTGFRDHEADIRKAGIEIVALSVDGLGPDDDSGPEVAQRKLEQLGFPFASAMASSRLLESLQGYHNALVTLQRPLPLPSSFLIDGEGRVSVMYKGPLKIDSLLADSQHSHGTRAQRWERSALLPGRTIQHESIAETADKIAETADKVEASMHFQYGLQQDKQGNLDDALYHYQEALRFRSNFALAHRRLGQLYLKKREGGEAEKHFRQALRIVPSDPETHYWLGTLNLQRRQFEIARDHYQETIRLQPEHVPARYDLAVLQHTIEGNIPAAMVNYRALLEFDPDHVSALNNLAWLLATHPDESIRDGREALRLARQVVQQTGRDNPFFLDLLAAAEAESGQFEAAVATARRAVAGAREANDSTLAAQIEARMLRYENRQAHRESPTERE